MKAARNPSSLDIHGEVSRSLRAFLAQGRLGAVTPSLWDDVQRKLLSSLSTESTQTIESTLAALKKERECVSDHAWSALKKGVRRALMRCERLQLLDALEETIFDDETLDTARPQSKKRTTPAGPSSSSPRKRPRHSDSASDVKDQVEIVPEQSLHLDTFYLLRSQHISNKKHTVSLDEIVTAGADLTVVCNFKFDVPWMWERAPAMQTSRKVLIVHGETDAEENEWKAFLNGQGALQRVRFARPRTPPYGTVHSKMFLLFFPTGCRVCIHTANMVAGDWDFKTQGAYVRDFPLQDRIDGRSQSAFNAHRSLEEDDFKTQLDRYFRYALVGELREEVARAIGKYDFSSAGVSLIASVPGIHKGFSKTHFGHARLREVLRKERIPSSGSGSIAVCQFSSLGSIQQKWLDEEFKDTLFASAERCSSDQSLGTDGDEIKLVFPTLHQVRQSNEGLQAGASLPVRGKNLHREHILSKLHRWDGLRSGYERAMPHIKTVLRYPAAQPQSPFWAFLGSFNLSVAAWGRMQGARKGKSSWDRLNVLSYETGILFSPTLACAPVHSIDGSIKYPVLSATQKVVWNEAKRDGRVYLEATPSENVRPERNELSGDGDVRVFLSLPLPYKLPPPKYTNDDVPWTTEHCTMA